MTLDDFIKQRLGTALVVWVFVLGFLGFLSTFSFVFGPSFRLSDVQAAASSTVNATSTVVVGNAAPTVSGAVVINGSASIVLTPNVTTTVNVNATVVDTNGCADITNATATIMIYRSTVTSSTCLTSADNRNCYRATAFTATSSCVASITVNTTTSFDVYYFADATDSSSSYPSPVAIGWMATLDVRDTSLATTTADSAAVELLTLTALNVTTSSINYGSMSASSTSGATNQVTTTTNAGNSTTTLKLSALSTLTIVGGSTSIATGNQRFSTSSFTYPGTSTALTEFGSAANVSSFLLTNPTSTNSTNNIKQEIYWGLKVDSGTATGTYNGFTTFTSVWQP